MRGLILAAGRGSRLNKLTKDKPKPLVELAGKTLFEWQNCALAEAGIINTAVVTGYRAEMFNQYKNIQIHNSDWAGSNMVRSLLCADKWLTSGDCVVSYGDIVYHPEIIKQLSEAEGQIVISYDTAWYPLWSIRFDDPLDDAESFLQHDNRLVDIGRKVTDIKQINGQYMGLFLIRPEGWDLIKQSLNKMTAPKLNEFDMTSLLRRLLEDNIEIRTVPITGRWLEVDDMEDMESYKQRLLSHQEWLHDWRWEYSE